MSALGQKQICPQVDVMCAFHPKADIPRRHDNVRLMPKAEANCRRYSMLSRGDTEADDCLFAQRLCGFQPMQTFD
jgi:hypothetical protein